MNTTTMWEWLTALPYGGEIRRYTSAQAYVAYRKRMQRMWIFIVPSIALEIIFGPLRHAHFGVRTAVILLFCGAIAVYLRAQILYVLAWDELQRRALAESGAITALIMLFVLGMYAYVDVLFQLPRISTIIWFALGGAIWFIALPLIRRHYES